MSGPRVLIIGIDGATYDNIGPWAEQGLLPNFKRVLDGGVHGDLASTIPPLTAPAWTSFMTGKHPGKHGLYNFVEIKPHSYAVRYTNARTRTARTIWEMLSAAGLRVGVVNVPMTYPPEPVNGFMISGLDAPEDSADITHPRELHGELRARFGSVSKQFRYLGHLKTDEHRQLVLDTLLDIDAHYHRMADHLFETRPVDVAMVVWTSTDTVSHFFYHYLSPSHHQYDPKGAERFGDAILRTHQRVDRIIGELAARLPEDGTLVLMSDHGFRPTSGRTVRVNRYLEELGLLTRKRRARGWARPLTQRIDRLLRKTLTPRQKERLAAWFPALRTKWESQAGGIADIDWCKTKAFSSDLLTFPPAIWINQKGLFPEGIVEPGAEYDDVARLVIEKLLALRDPVTAEPLISKVWTKNDAYWGPHLEHAPDLTPACWDGISFLGRASVGHDDVVAFQGSAAPGPGEWTGAHSMGGILAMQGRAFRAGHRLEGASIVDVVPTILHLLGLPVPADLDGRVLEEAFTETFNKDRPVRREDLRDESTTGGRAAETYSEDESEKVAERLRGLGYTE